MIIGTIEISAATEIAHHSSPRLEFWPASRMGRVCHFDEVRSSAKRNSFQMKASTIIEVAMRPGRDIGSTIWKKIRSRPILSTIAASSTSTGTVVKKSRISQTAKGSPKAV